MAAVMLSSNFKDITAPLLNSEFDGVYDQRDDEQAKVFKERPGIQRSYEEQVVLYGFSAAPQIADGTAVGYQSGGELYATRYFFKQYGAAFGLTKVLVEDGDHIRIGQTYARHLAQSLVETKETLGANVLNFAFNNAYVGGDGVSLISASHPAASGPVQSNQLTSAAALSQTSLEQLLIQIMNATDSTGKRIRLKPTQLVSGTSNSFQIETLLKTPLRVGVANNDINPVKSSGMLSESAILTRITSPTAWFIQTNVNDFAKGLQLLTRRKMEKSMEGDFETDSMRYKATERYAFGWTDWRDMYGTPGI
jgi:hypothetical protein